jgi:hypothetical protein
LVSPDVIGVPVAAVRAVAHHDLRTHLLEHLDQRIDLLLEDPGSERPRMQLRRRARPRTGFGDHAGVTPAADPAEKPLIGEAEHGTGRPQLGQAVATELVGPISG